MRDDAKHTAVRMCNQVTRDGTAPPAHRPTVQVLVADDDEVGPMGARIFGDLFAIHQGLPP